MRISLPHINVSLLNVCKFSLLTPIMLMTIACSPTNTVNNIANIVPPLPFDRASSGFSANNTIGQDILQANVLLAEGKQREAANAYFRAAPNYPSPERERLILQAAELTSLIKDPNLTQQYLAPLNFGSLNNENQIRFRLVQSQLALNDRNYRETLRILPQRVDNVPEDLGKKVLSTRMSAAQASGDRLSLIQELVLQETNLKERHEVSLNHNRIWGHSKQIPAFQLEEAKNNINHPIVKNWLSLAQLSRIEKNGPANKKATFRSDLGNWIQNNPNHPGMSQALSMLTIEPTTVVTPYTAQAKAVITSTTKKPTISNNINKAPVITSSVNKAPIITSTVKKQAVQRQPVQAPRPVTPARVTAPKVVTPAPKVITPDPNIKSLYENLKKQIKQ